MSVSNDDDIPDIYDVNNVGQRLNSYTQDQRDSLLPEIYTNQLQKRNTLPDSIKGVAIDPMQLRRKRWVFNSMPRDVNRHSPAVYPLMESMPVRFDLQDPELAFTLDNGSISIFKIDGMTIDERKTERFARMLSDRGFKYPAREVRANITTRKPYDSGYLIIDDAGDVYHLKMQAGRPAIARIQHPEHAQALHVAITEFGDKQFLGFVQLSDNTIWGIGFEDYSLIPLPLEDVDLSSNRVNIFRSLLSWTARINYPDSTAWVAVNSFDYKKLGSYEQRRVSTRAEIISSWIIPYEITLTSDDTTVVTPGFTLGTPRAIILWLSVFLMYFVTIFLKRNNKLKTN